MAIDPRRAQLLTAHEEYAKRVVIDQHTRDGYYDDNGIRQGGLIAFVRYFWKVLEPETPFIDGWVLWAMCEHLEAVTNGDVLRLLINVPPGSMKALDCDTEVLTTDGWKKHGNLSVGDHVYGADGSPKRIIARTPNAEEKCFEITFDDGANIVAGAGHLWAIERDTSIHGKWSRVPEVVSTLQLRAGDKHGTRRCADRISLTSPLAGNLASLPIDPYLLGVWLGDGASDQGVIYCGDDDFAHFSELGHEVAGTQTARRISVECLTTRLRSLGLLNNKHVPELYLISSVAQRWSLLQGLMDTDGQVSSQGWCRFTTGNRVLAENFLTLTASLGIKTRIGSPFFDATPNRKRNGPYFRIRFTAPPESKIFRLQRKQSRIKNKITRGIKHRYVVSVKEVESRLVNCIQVQDSLYLATNRFVVTHNSLLVDCFWPAWEWGPKNLASLRYVAFSYAATLTLRDNNRFRDLVTSDEYQRLYGDRVTIKYGAKAGAERIINTRRGWKFASSVGGVGTGERGDRVILDDPHNVKEIESKTVREEVARWFREAMSNRLNNPETGAIVIIMQRLHEDDISGVILAENLDYTHLMIPMEYQWEMMTDAQGRPRINQVGWVDPRYEEDPKTCEGVLAWPERFSRESYEKIKKEIGPYATAGQYQQVPAPRGGEIFQTKWWRVWDPPDWRFPKFDYVFASLDGAYTSKEENDPSAMTVWGTFTEKGQRGIMLIRAWRKHLQFSATYNPDATFDMNTMIERGPKAFLDFKNKYSEDWGLMEWVMYTCLQYDVHKLLIEGKATGITAAQELRNRYGLQNFSVQICQPKGDKVARALAVQPTFSQGLVWAPVFDWSQMVIDEMALFPKGKFDDLTDSTTQAMKFARDAGLLQTHEEVDYEERERLMFRPKRQKSLYPV